MRRLWTRWVDHCVRPLDTRVLALVRMGLAACVLLDLLQVAWVGAAEVMFRPFAQGGLSAFKSPDFVLGGLLGPDAGMVAFVVTMLCMLAVFLGIATRPALLLGAFLYAQLGALFPPGDRVIDHAIRTVFLVLIMSGAHARWSLGRRLLGKAPRLTALAWPADLVRWLLVLIYLSAGLVKLGSNKWHTFAEPPVLYRILADPTSANLDHLTWAGVPWLFHAGALVTLIVELSAPLILTRFAPWWAVGGALLHLGIAATMGLGMFSWGMLALYPVLFAPWLLRALDRLGRSHRVGPARPAGLSPGAPAPVDPAPARGPRPGRSAQPPR